MRGIRLAKQFGNPPSLVRPLCGASLAIDRGERVVEIGKSAFEKCSLLNLFGSLDRPTGGSILVEGHDLGGTSSDELVRHRQSTVDWILQPYSLIPSRATTEKVEMPMILAGRLPRLRRRAETQVLEAVGLGTRAFHRPVELSGGEHQRVAIARALVNRPRVLLANEPTGNLDLTIAADIKQLLLRLLPEGRAALVLESQDEELALLSCDQVVWMRDGEIIP